MCTSHLWLHIKIKCTSDNKVVSVKYFYLWIDIDDLSVTLVFEEQTRGVLCDHLVVGGRVGGGCLGLPVVETETHTINIRHSEKSSALISNFLYAVCELVYKPEDRVK